MPTGGWIWTRRMARDGLDALPRDDKGWAKHKRRSSKHIVAFNVLIWKYDSPVLQKLHNSDGNMLFLMLTAN
jgi:hypothetical protein